MDEALQTMIDNMPDKTGKSLAQWKEILKQKNFDKHSEGVKYLKSEHQVTHGFANTIVTLSKEASKSGDDLVESQYHGKEDLKPIYDKLIRIMKGFGQDITITPKKTTVSVIRKRQFALIKPATKTRIDLGLKIKDRPNEGRLEGSGPFGTMCTHRIKISTNSEIDSEIISWMKEAYQAST